MKNVNESGRSMVEMLGVLAIIGVLSIGGIAGYTMAMNKYQANEIINTVAQAAVYCRTKSAAGAILTSDGTTNTVEANREIFATITCDNVDTGKVTFTLQSAYSKLKDLAKKGLPSSTEGTGGNAGKISYTPSS